MQIAILDLLAPIAQICRGCPTQTLNLAYVDAARRFCNKSRWLRVTIPGSTTALTQLYSLGSDVYNEILGIQAISVVENVDDTHALTESVSTGWDPNEDPSVPDFYQYVPEGQFAVHPTPDQGYTLTVSAAVQPKRGSNSIDDTLIINWEYVLRSGALAYLLKLPGTAWTDKAEALQQEVMFRHGMNEGLLSAERGYNAGAIPVSRIGPSTGAIRSRILPI